MKKCDVCGATLRMMGKFKYTNGYICKECYKKASRQFTETITQKSLAEIKVLCEAERDEAEFDSFEITGRIGNYLLVDEKHDKICIPNNRITNKQVSDPEFYDVRSIKKCEITFSPEMPFEELKAKTKRREEGTVKYLKVRLWFYDKPGKKEISLIANPVRMKSYAFRQSLNFAERIEAEILRLMENVKGATVNEAV